MELADRTLDLPIGPDGRYRIASDSIDGIPPGTRAAFRDNDELVLDLNLIGKINRYELNVRFVDSEMRVGIVESTGTFHTTVVGRRRH